MLPTYEELIEKMAEAIINQAEYSISPEKRQAQLRAQNPYWSDVAKAALQALLENLPSGFVLEEETCGKDLNGNEIILAQEIIDNRALYYKQLLAMRRINS